MLRMPACQNTFSHVISVCFEPPRSLSLPSSHSHRPHHLPNQHLPLDPNFCSLHPSWSAKLAFWISPASVRSKESRLSLLVSLALTRESI
ncbi:hypothetical protein VTO42DRAFT_5433 [Malbranchea cinnamomea]